jgi:ABC-type transport system substrate-binding protein
MQIGSYGQYRIFCSHTFPRKNQQVTQKRRRLMIPIVSRRNMHWSVVLTMLLVMTMVVTACRGAQPTAAPATPTAPAAQAATPTTAAATPTTAPPTPTEAAPAVSPHQAPQFQEMVKAGTLPPLEQRLPANPRVIEPLDSIGQYGGTMRHPLLGSWSSRFYSFMGDENLLVWTPNWDGLLPNVAESYEVNEDSSEFTFHLREGMKWSDGEDFNAEDHVLVQRRHAQRRAHPSEAAMADRGR